MGNFFSNTFDNGARTDDEHEAANSIRLAGNNQPRLIVPRFPSFRSNTPTFSDIEYLTEYSSSENGETIEHLIGEQEVVLEKSDELKSNGYQRRITHYSRSQMILLVGEGDFSFSACLAKAFGSATNMVATSLDSEEELSEKYLRSNQHIQELRSMGCMVLHDVGVHDMLYDPVLMNMKFDRIIFNFPHAGHFPPLYETDAFLIETHKKLLSGFFKSSSKMLNENGEVHVSHRDDYPYNKWEIGKLASKAGLRLIEKVRFRKVDYPGYSNKRGGDIESDKEFYLGDRPYTFKFTSNSKLTNPN